MNKIEDIQKLKSLFDQGAISEEEFTLLKKKVLSSINQPLPIVNKVIPKTSNATHTKTIPDTNSNFSFIRFGVVALIVVIIGSVMLTYNNNQGVSSNNDDSQVRVKERKVCDRCNGTGIEVCKLCGGTGVTNIGTTCTCITTYQFEIQMGHTPSYTPLRWTCRKCKGTGYLGN